MKDEEKKVLNSVAVSSSFLANSSSYFIGFGYALSLSHCILHNQDTSVLYLTTSYPKNVSGKSILVLESVSVSELDNSIWKFASSTLCEFHTKLWKQLLRVTD